MRSDRFLPAGTRVCLKPLDQDAEYGVVVHCWLNPEIGQYDNFVAFFGNAFPDDDGPPDDIYILRYASTTLDVLED